MCRDQQDLTRLSVSELRAERAALRHTEARVSYERRLVQGRIDLLRAELRSRQGDAQAGSLADRLAVALTDRDDLTASPDAVLVTTLRVDVPEGSEGHFDDHLMDFAELDTEELAAHAAQLERREEELSTQRRSTFVALDQLVAELADRYRDDVPLGELLGG